MNEYIRDKIHYAIEITMPMIIVSVVVFILLRIIYLIKNKQKIVLYKELTYLAFIIYLLSLFQLVTLQDAVSWSTNNFIPLKEITRYNIGSDLFIKNVIGNILLFVPFGFFISYILKSKRWFEPFIITVICSCTIEFVQLSIGRVFDVDDILLNLIGGVIGYIIYKLIRYISSKLPSFLKNKYFLDFISIVIVIAIIGLIILL